MDIPGLLYKIARNEASQAELQAFAAHLETLDAAAYREMLEQYGEVIHSIKIEEPANLAIWESISEKIRETPGEERRMAAAHSFEEIRGRRIHFIKRFRWVAAAIFIAAIAFTAIQILNKKTGIPAATASADIAAPDKNRATIQLADGRTVYLDQVANGTVTAQGNVQMTKLSDGQIVYSGSSSEMLYNTLVNPQGSKVIDMAFADGSHIWLNAGSSVKYPLSFSGKKREVEITGEAYFDVKHNEQMPFIVHAGSQVIEDLGTAFNVNAYSNEPAVRTTLIQGEVKIGNIKLVPGEQLNGNKVIRPDLKEVVAWKNNEFVFNGASTEEVMRQMERWYAIKVVYAGAIPGDRFEGTVSREYTVSEALKVLEASGVKFIIQGKELIVQP